MNSPELSFLHLVFPSDLLDDFTIVHFHVLCDISTKEEIYEIFLDEKNVLPEDIDVSEYESKGFDSSRRIQDFPLRGRAVFLIIRKRIWRHKETNQTIKRHYNLVANGTRITQELSDFLK
jgi:hypothetical protein